jgi:Mg/Co/Ni transporter MgtE
MKAQDHLAVRFAAAHPGEVARRLELVPPRDAASFLAALEPAVAAEVVEGMLPSTAAAAFEVMSSDELSSILARLPAARCVLVLRSVSAPDRREFVSLLPQATAAKVARLLRSSVGSAGVLAEPVAAVLSPEMAVDEALRTLEKTSGSSTYVVDGDHKLVGVVHRRDLSKGDQRTRVGGLMTRHVVKLPAAASLAAIRKHRAWVDFEKLPVVDGSGVLVGEIRHRNIRRAGPARRAVEAASSGAALGVFLELGGVYWSGLTSVLEAFAGRTVGAGIAEVNSGRE